MVSNKVRYIAADSSPFGTHSKKKMGVHGLFVHGRWVAYLFLTLLTVVSVLDQYNAHTVRLYDWMALILFGLALSGLFLPYWLAQAASLRYAARTLFAVPDGYAPLTKGKKKVRESPQPASEAMINVADEKTGGKRTAGDDVQAHRSVWHARDQITFHVVHLVIYLHAAVQIVFLYRYTGDVTGFQSALDSQGFSTSSPATYVEEKKLLLLQWLQVSWLVISGVAAQSAITCLYMGVNTK